MLAYLPLASVPVGAPSMTSGSTNLYLYSDKTGPLDISGDLSSGNVFGYVCQNIHVFAGFVCLLERIM